MVIVFGVTFGVLNAHTVRLDYYFHSSDILLPILLVITLIIGVILGWMALYPSLMRLRFKNMQLRRQLKKYSKAVAKVEAAE
jgi:uncharacterized membrane protein YciS (DUF1049 family)